MKLLTHNMLSCHIKGVTNGYPFKIEAEKVLKRCTDRLCTAGELTSCRVLQVELTDADYDPSFLRHIFPKIEWPALVEGAKSLGAQP